MSRHNRQRNKRHARGLWKVFSCLVNSRVLETILHRLNTTGKFPGWATRTEREAIKRFGNIGNFVPEENTPF